MKVVLDIRKTVEQNAQEYFEKAKKAKRKIEGAKKASEHWQHEKEKLLVQQQKEQAKEEEKKQRPVVEKKWYHKFRWFKTSDGFLVIGGRDATTNELVIKKHTDENDFVFHTDMAGSPFFVIKSDGRTISEIAIRETADATCTFSRAFKLGMARQAVFYVKPSQVTKEAKSGEYLTKGAFVIRGKTTYVDNKINLTLGITAENELMAAPLEAVKAHCKTFLVIVQGKEKISSVAKKIAKLLDYPDLDGIIRVLPAGEFQIGHQTKQ